MAMVEARVDRLEEVLEEFITNVGIEFNKLYNSQLRTEAELRLFREDTQAFKEEGREQNREMNRRWGELANKMGTLVEDLVIPSLPRIIKELLDRDVIDLMARWRRKLADGRVREYDAVAVTADLICLNSAKSTLRSAEVDRFVEEIDHFREFFPEYRDHPVVGMLASLAVEESVLNYAEKQGFVVLAVGDQVMEVKNRPGFVPKRW